MIPTVRHTKDFERVRDLPRRAPSEVDAKAWAAVLTEEYAIPGSGAALRPWQAFSLAEVAEVGGGVLGLTVGVLS